MNRPLEEQVTGPTVGDNTCLSVVSACSLRFCDQCPPCLGDGTRGQALRTEQFRFEGLSETEGGTSERLFWHLLLSQRLQLKNFNISKWHVFGVA